MPNGVLILAELADGELAPITQELVGAAQRLNAGPVSAMLIGSGVEGAAAKITGVEKVYVVDSAALAEYTDHFYASDIVVPRALGTVEGTWLDTNELFSRASRE